MSDDELAPITPTSIALVRVHVPLIRPFTTSFGRQTSRDVLLVRVAAGEHVGWGEVTTMAAPRYNEEFTDGAALVLTDHLVPELLRAGTPIAGAEVPVRLRAIHGHRMAKAGLEVAVLDAQLRAGGRRLADHLGAVTERVPAGVSVGIPDGGIDELLREVTDYLDAGYLRIKAKVEPGNDVEPMRALRSHIGPGVDLQIDANAAYDPDYPEHLAALDVLDTLGLTMLEQPFAPERLRDHARHARRWRTPVCLDESIHDARSTVDAIESGAAGVINIKLGRVGGIHEAVRIRDVARERGIPVWCGGMLETGVGRAANVALAALDGFRFPGDTSASDRYFAADVTDPFELVDGHLEVPTGPGIGRTPRPEQLEDAEVAVVWRA